MFKRITKLMTEIIDLHDFSADIPMLTGDLGAMDLQTVRDINAIMLLKVCDVYYKSTIMYYCVFIFACWVKVGWLQGDAFCNCGCKVELLAKTKGV